MLKNKLFACLLAWEIAIFAQTVPAQPATQSPAPTGVSRFRNDVETASVAQPAIASASLVEGAGATAQSTHGLIAYICDTSINAVAGVCNTLNSTIAGIYANAFTNANASIYIRFGVTGLGQSVTAHYTSSYAAFRNALISSETDADDRTAVANSVPANNPFGVSVLLTTANAKALGFTPAFGVTPALNSCTLGAAGCYDGIITISDAVLTMGNLYFRNGSPIGFNQFDFYTVVEHETDEVLGTASCAFGCGNVIAPADLFRYQSNGTRSPQQAGNNNSCQAPNTGNACFSIDGVNMLQQYNNVAGGDAGDWMTSCSSQLVQDAALCGNSAGIDISPAAEIRVLDVVGFSTVSTTVLGAGSDGYLYSIFPVTGGTTRLGQLPAIMSDIAAYNGALYGISFSLGSSILYSLDPATGIGRPVGSNTGASLNSLAFGPTGILYAAGGDSLYTLNTSTGAASLVGNGSGNGTYQTSGDLEFDSAGNLYVTSAIGGDALLSVDPATGQGTTLGNTGFPNIYGLAYLNGTMYGFDGAGQVLTINLSNGAATAVASYSPVFNGTTIFTPAPALTVTKTHTGNFTGGQQGALFTVVVSNAANAAPSSGTVTVTETGPTGLTLTSLSGIGWSCGGNTCRRSDVLATGASFSPITVTVNVAASAPSTVTNQVSVSGGGSNGATAGDTVTVLQTVSVTVGTIPSGLSFSVDGTAFTSQQSLSWVPGSGHTVCALSPQAAASQTQYLWTGWSDGGSACHIVAASSAVGAYTATFKTQYQLTVAAAPAAGGTVAPVSGAYYDSGTVVSASASANSGYSFSSWSGDVSGSSNPVNLTMNAPKSILANFASNLLPDLVITSLTGPSATTPGAQINISLVLANQGTGTAGAFRSEFYFTPVPVFSLATATDTGFNCPVNGLAPGAVFSCAGAITAPSSLTPGVWYLAAFADSSSQVAESNENNNSRIADSGTITVTLPLSGTTTSLASSTNPSFFNQSIKLSATVSSAAATGSVVFQDGSTVLGTGVLSGGSAGVTVSTLPVGTHSLTAVYGGDIHYSGSASASLVQTVIAGPPQPWPQCPQVGSSPSCGVLIVANADNSVSVYTASNPVVPPYDGTASSPEDVLVGFQNNSTGTIRSLPLSGGTAAIFAFDGDGICDTLSGNVPVPRAPGCGTAGYGPYGYEGPGVTFANINGTFSSLGCSFPAPWLCSSGNGSYTTGTVYFNSGIQPGATAYFGLEAPPAGQNITVAPIVASISPVSAFVGATTFNLTITGLNFPGGATVNWTGPSGQSTTLIPSSVSTTQINVSIGSQLTATTGIATVTVVSAGGAPSNPITFAINPSPTTTTLTASPNPSIPGQSVTLTATVSPSSAGGTVSFRDGSVVLGNKALSSGVAVMAFSTLSAGTHSLTAVYGGDTNDASGTSPVLTQTVNSGTPVISGSNVSYAFTWAGTAPAAATPVAVTSTPSGVAGLSLSASGSCAWLNAALSGSATPATLDTSVNGTALATLAPAVYVCNLSVSAAGASAAQMIATLTVSPPAFLSNEVSLGGGLYYLQFPNNTLFGYFAYVTGMIAYHLDFGYAGVVPANAQNGAYLYDFQSGHWLYTTSASFPSLYDFTLKSWIYYFQSTTNPGHYTTNPRYFANLTTNKIFTM